MPSTYSFIFLGIIFIILLLVVLLFIPSSNKPVLVKKKKSEPEEPQKDWQGLSLRLEKHIQTLRKNIADLEKKQKEAEKDLLKERELNKQYKEKMTQEEGWHKREQDEIDKKAKELVRLKEIGHQAEENLEKEHSQRLHFEREFKETKINFEEVDGKFKKAEMEISNLKAQLNSVQKEFNELKRTHADLKKKNEDTTFISKSEYDRVEKLLREKEKELERVQRQGS